LEPRSLGLLAALTAACLALAACLTKAVAADPPKQPPQPASAKERVADTKMTGQDKKPSQAELKKRLSPLQYEVTQEAGTEPPFDNTYWNNHAAGIYVDVVSGEPLFSSREKFESGTGWPSFWKPLEDGNLVQKEDQAYGMTRVEVRSKHAGSHLGHLFDDGPAPTGKRYCMNSAAMRFIPAAKLNESGYGQYAQLFPEVKQTKENALQPAPAAGTPQAKATTTREVAILAGGCFWGMEDILRKIPGVLDTEAGYTGGTVDKPGYGDVHTGKSGHAESVRVTFNPQVITYEALLGFFFRMHDPTTLNRQGNDVGSQYRSAIFYTSDEQRKTAEAVKSRVNHSGKWPKPIVTEIVPAKPFYAAEDEHQDYLVKHPDGYTCHYLRD
jgi:peptide methionine sulfoxide reductase msrA/msrB